MIKRVVVLLLITLFLYVGLSYVTEGDIDRSVLRMTHSVMDIFQKKSKLYNLVVPKLPGNIHSQSYFSNHWQGDKGFFVLVASDITSSEGPSLTAEEFKPLFKTMRVRILYEKSQPEDIDGELRKWVFIADEAGDDYLGWVLKDQLVMPHQFEVMKDPAFSRFSYEKGEYSAKVSVDQKGRFSIDWESEGSGLHLKGDEEGQLYDYDDIIWIKKKDQDYFIEFFILDDNSHLSQERRFYLDTITTNIYTVPE